MNVTFLGTSCMQPTRERNHPGVLLEYNGDYILFDCGENIQRQMRVANLKTSKITVLCISHWHGDHVFGIPGLLQSMVSAQYMGVLIIIGPKGTKKKMNYLLKAYESKRNVEMRIIEAGEGCAFEHEHYEIHCAPLRHNTPTLGYRFVEKEKRRIDMAKVKRLGIPQGPLLGKLQKNQSVSFEGKVIDPDAISSLEEGRVFTYIADTLVCDSILSLADKATLLVIESTFHSKDKEKAKLYAHLTAAEAAQMAKKAGVSNLILFHFSQRYKSVTKIHEEAQHYFPNAQVSHDFMSIDVQKKK